MASGELRDRFPTDRELTADYGVSRQTARDAVRHLREEGVVTRERGRGSFIRPRTIEQPLGSLYSLYRSIEAAGYTQRSQVVHLDERRDHEVAGRLGLDPAEPLVYVERIRLADDEPVALDRSWLPSRVASGLLDADLHHSALYDALAERCGVQLTGGWERIRPQLPTEEQRAALAIHPHQPVFGVERLAHAGTTPVEWRTAVVRGDRYAFTASWGTEPSTPVLGPDHLVP